MKTNIKGIKILLTASIFLVLCLIISQFTINATVANSSGYYIFSKSNKELIKESDLKFTDEFTQLLAKNELFARYGYKFKDKTLFEYFSNMPWYKPNSAISGNFSILNKIEQANFNLIESYYQKRKSSNIQVNSSQLLTEGNKKYWKQEVSKDLNGDGVLESLTIKFYVDSSDSSGIYFNSYQIIVSSKGRTYSIKDKGSYLSPGIKFADFNVYDKTTQMYIVENGPSADYTVRIYTFNGNGIVKSPYVIGLINSYDGKSKIYTDINALPDKNKTITSYYDFAKGFVPLSKQSLINKELTFACDMPLLRRIDDKDAIPIVFLYQKNDWKSILGDNLFKIIPKNTKFIITDFVAKKFDDSWYDIWVKIKTPSGEQGFIRFVHGD